MLDLNGGFAVLVDNFEWPMFPVALDFGIVKPTTKEPFSIKNGIFGIGVESVFSGIPDPCFCKKKLVLGLEELSWHVQAFVVSKANP